LGSSVDLLQDLGIDRIFEHATSYVDALEHAVVELGFRSLRSSDAELRSSFLAAVPPDGVSVMDLRNALGRRGIVVGIPDGNLRLAPHWHNSLDEVPVVVNALRESLKEVCG
jgi:aspartate aminotransferase-like enzyme